MLCQSSVSSFLSCCAAPHKLLGHLKARDTAKHSLQALIVLLRKLLVILEGISSSNGPVQEELKETLERIEKYDARLAEVRTRRAAMAAALEENAEDRPGQGEFDDTASEGGSSMVSGLSLYTQASTGRVSTASGSSLLASTVGGRLPSKKQKKVGALYRILDCQLDGMKCTCLGADRG